MKSKYSTTPCLLCGAYIAKGAEIRKVGGAWVHSPIVPSGGRASRHGRLRGVPGRAAGPGVRGPGRRPNAGGVQGLRLRGGRMSAVAEMICEGMALGAERVFEAADRGNPDTGIL